MRRPRLSRIAASFTMIILLAGCSGIQSALDPQAREALEIDWLFRIFVIVCSAVWIAVMLALLAGLIFSNRTSQRALLAGEEEPVRERVIAVATVLTAVTIIGFTVLSYLTDKSLAKPGAGPVSITLTGHQWWWDIRYDDPEPSRGFTTANELHVPVGIPVRLSLQSTDVIHSFWVPSVSGKKDLIPGWKNDLTFTVTREGIYRGQCAEFCGLQHAHMGLLLIAEPPDRFDSWSKDQIATAAPPPEALKKGEAIFMSRGCILCHTVRGTRAGGRVGPDLTHFGSRQSIAADTLPLTHENLVAWIRDPQGIKPGANMPRVELTESERGDLASYLESLK